MTPRTQLSHLSFSSLNSAASCRRGWFSRYILNRQSPPGEGAAFGRAAEERISADLRVIASPAAHRPQKVEAVQTPAVPLTGIAADKVSEAVADQLQSDLDRASEVYRTTAGVLLPNGSVEGVEILGQVETWLEPGVWESLADFYGVSLDYLVGRSDDPTFTPSAGTIPCSASKD